MTVYHKHKGYMSNGKLKSHPVGAQHKDPQVQKYHNESLKGKSVSKPVEPKEASKILTAIGVKPKVSCGTWIQEGFLYVDASQLPVELKGVRLRFQRREGNTKRTVGLEVLR